MSPSPEGAVLGDTSTTAAEVPHVELGGRPWTYPANRERSLDGLTTETDSTWMFSRMARMASSRASLSGRPSLFLAAAKKFGTSRDSPSRMEEEEASEEEEEAAASATLWTKVENVSLRLAKSVSDATFTSAAALEPPSLEMWIPTNPSSASLPATLEEALAVPCLRSHSCALARSFWTSSAERAFLHSIMGAPVSSRSCLTREAMDGWDCRGWEVEKKEQDEEQCDEEVVAMGGKGVGVDDDAGAHLVTVVDRAMVGNRLAADDSIILDVGFRDGNIILSYNIL